MAETALYGDIMHVKVAVIEEAPEGFFDKCYITIKAGNFVCQPYILHLENCHLCLHIVVLNHDTKVLVFLELYKYFKLNNLYNILITNALC